MSGHLCGGMPPENDSLDRLRIDRGPDRRGGAWVFRLVALGLIALVAGGYMIWKRRDGAVPVVRTAIARANVTDPTLLLCDEPTGDLDRKAGDEILSQLQALNQRQGKTIVMVTHDPHAATRCSRVLYRDEGHLTDQAPS